jgi:hypothetical protein
MREYGVRPIDDIGWCGSRCGRSRQMYDIKQEKRRRVEDEMHAKATRRWRGQVISASSSLPSTL